MIERAAPPEIAGLFTDEARFATWLEVEILASEGADVRYHDPFVPEIRVRRTPFAAGGDLVTLRSVALDKGELAGADVVALLVAHTSLDLGLILEHAKLVFDAVNATKGRSGLAHVERL